MRSFLRFCVCLSLALFLLVGCSGKENEAAGSAAERAPYDPSTLSDCLTSVTYRDRTVTLTSEEASKSEAVWQAILSDAQMLSYPSEQVSYYESQIRAEYRYLAEREGMSYEEMLTLCGGSEEQIAEEARQMVKSDLVLLYIVSDAGISLTEQEKSEHFERYAEKYAENYGYDRAYAEEHLREEIYESMLFDKTMEYLILRNHFEVRNG